MEDGEEVQDWVIEADEEFFLCLVPRIDGDREGELVVELFCEWLVSISGTCDEVEVPGQVSEAIEELTLPLSLSSMVKVDMPRFDKSESASITSIFAIFLKLKTQCWFGCDER